MEQMSTTSSGADLATKFQKLAAEYSKIRAQLPVLKKAVVDEQAKVSNLEEELREKGQIVRTLSTESESLTFRNQQLTKRVEYLQERLDDAASSNNSSPGRFFRRPSLSAKHNRNPLTQSVSQDQLSAGGDPLKRALEEELKRKLEENERLNKQIFETESAHQNEIVAMKNCIRLLESEAESLRNELANIKDRQEAVLAELRSEKAQLRKQTEQAQIELKDVQKECQYNAEARNELAAQVDSSNRLISERIILDDNQHEEWNRLNAPALKSSFRNDFFQALSALQPLVAQTLTHLGLFHSYWKQRAQLYPCDTNLGETMSDTNTKLCILLRDNATVCRAIESSFQDLVDKSRTDDGFANLTPSNLSAIVTAFGDYDRFLKESVSFMERAMEDECAVGWCNPRLEKENRAFLDVYTSYVSGVNHLLGPLQLLIDGRTVDDALVNTLASALEKLDECIRGLCDQFSSKILNEHQLPVATRQLRTTNECIAAALNSASKYSSELARSFNEQQAVLIRCSIELQHRRVEWSVWRKQAAEYQRAIAANAESDSATKSSHRPSIPVSASWHNIRYNGIDADKEAVESEWKARLDDAQKSLGALEREKEKWVLETQLLKMKLDQCQQQQSSNRCSTVAGSVDDRRSDDSAYVEEYYGNRVAEMSSQLQDANSRIAFFQSECQNLLKTIQIYQKHKEKANQDLKVSSQQNVSLKDELETTRKGYEMQLSTLSEHLAQMNQRLTKQTDEIDMLRQAMKDKVQKKNRFK